MVQARHINIGNPTAEYDSLLAETFVDNGDFASIASLEDRRAFIIGRTGSGKSAALAQLKRLSPEVVITINPTHLGLKYITNNDVLRVMRDRGVRVEQFYTYLWKHVFVIEILRHVYANAVDSHARLAVLDRLRARFRGKPNQNLFDEYLRQYGEKFWNDTQEVIEEAVEKFSKKIRTSGEIGADIHIGKVGGAAEIDVEESTERRSERQRSLQEIVNNEQLGKLERVLAEIARNLVETEAPSIFIAIDDLDLEWVEQEEVLPLLNALFDATLDMIRIDRIKILVALRTNIFMQLSDFGSRRQREKVDAQVLVLRWTSRDLEAVVDERLDFVSGRQNISPKLSVQGLLPTDARNGVDPFDYIVERTLLRPRDAIRFFNELLIEANEIPVSWEEIVRAERKYSQSRLEALIDEWSPSAPGIERVFDAFKGGPITLSKEEMSEVLQLAAVGVMNSDPSSSAWMEERARSIYQLVTDNSTWSGVEWVDIYGRLAFYLYETSFIGVRFGASESLVFSYDPDFDLTMRDLERNIVFEIHPAFATALQLQQKTGQNQ